VLVLRPDGTEALLLNVTGGVVWNLCDGTRTIDEIASFVSSTVQAPDPGVVRSDVSALLARLAEAGLVEDLERCGPSPSTR
jgi:hypothetical protein